MADPKSGFCTKTKTFHSLRPPVPLPPESIPLSFPSFAFSLLPSPLPTHPALIDSATNASLSYPQFLTHVHSLASSLQLHTNLSKGHVAFILSPASLDVPILYFALLSIGVIVSPSNPANTPAEISRQFDLVNPSIAFATSSTAAKLPRHVTTVLFDSPQFQSFLTSTINTSTVELEVRQSDVAAIQYSSGTTGKVKAAALSHRSFIAMAAGFHVIQQAVTSPALTLLAAPMFHSMGFFFVLKGVALGETAVVMDRPGFPEMMRVAERYRATQMTAAPPVVVAMARSEVAMRYDLKALERVVTGGAPLAVEAAERFRLRFPGVELCQV